MSIVGTLILILLLSQTAPPPAQAPVVETQPAVFLATPAGIVLPNQCAEVDLAALGLTCSEAEPCPSFLELSAVEALGNLLVVTGNVHTSSTTLQSVLLLSEDSGASWREAHPRIKASALESMQFIDFATGWISGQAFLGLPRDPFLLLTTDSGRSWRKVDIYAESRVGVIEGFAFQSTRKGWLLIDNRGSGEAGKYEFYETQTGGSSWELREISSRIPKGAQAEQRSEAAGARLRVDEKKGLYRVELRSGNGWREVSSFKLKLEDCKPNP
jgi:photosystem II stability/assembly factor-like uncharacterized protein